MKFLFSIRNILFKKQASRRGGSPVFANPPCHSIIDRRLSTGKKAHRTPVGIPAGLDTQVVGELSISSLAYSLLIILRPVWSHNKQSSLLLKIVIFFSGIIHKKTIGPEILITYLTLGFDKKYFIDWLFILI